ncbi:MAG TPA: serine hydrolase domain-containing protein [Stellaceae bacterium]
MAEVGVMGEAVRVFRELPDGARIEGVCAPAFAGVLDVFAENFAARGEVGASVAITIGGETVVDLWGGVADPATGRPWERDTISIVFSNTKAATALCAHILAERGTLDLDAPLGLYWPAFRDARRAAITTRMVLGHTAGLPVLRGELKPGAFFDWDYMIARLEREEPFWEPGTRTGYHPLNFGWLVGEVVRRVASRTLGEFFRETVAAPLGLDFWIGLPESEEGRVAPIILHEPSPDDPPTRFTDAVRDVPSSIPALYVANARTWRPDGLNTRAAHAAEIGAAGGITNARGLAGMYRPLANGGAIGGHRVVGPDMLRGMTEIVSATHDDATLRVAARFGSGFMRSMETVGVAGGSVVLSPDAFGHAGAGGSLGFADPAVRMSLGYTMNRMGFGVLLNERGQALADAAYRALGYHRVPGYWMA